MSPTDESWLRSVGVEPEAYDPHPEPVSRVDKALTAGAKALHLCGYGPDNGWSIRIANVLFVDCPCCLVWRGMSIGFVLGAACVGAGVALFRSF